MCMFIYHETEEVYLRSVLRLIDENRDLEVALSRIGYEGE